MSDRSIRMLIERVFPSFDEALITQGIARLADKDRRVFCLYWGIGADHAYTLQEIGDREGITRHRVYQINTRARRRLLNICTKLRQVQ